MPRSYQKNAGVIACKDIPDDQYIVGSVIVLMDKRGNYSTRFRSGSLDGIPAAETQEALGGMVATAYELANLGVSS